MLRIGKQFHFSASHVLDRLPSWHQCARMHGHNYLVELELTGRREQLGEVGFVRDFGDLDDFKRWLDETLDHRHLNEVLDGWHPSAENLAMWIYDRWADRLPELTAVVVRETPGSWAEYRPEK